MRALAGAAMLIAAYITPEPETTGYRMLLGAMLSLGFMLVIAGLFEGTDE